MEAPAVAADSAECGDCEGCAGADRLPLLPITLPRTLRACASLPLTCQTLFIGSYPKSGTTWLQNMAYELVTRGGRPLDHISTYCPFYENDASWTYDHLGSPGAYSLPNPNPILSQMSHSHSS